MPFHIRPRRSARLRTRLDNQAVLAALRVFLAEPGPEGLQRLLAKGFISEGRVDPPSFHFVYRYNNPKNPQSYDVDGTIQDTPDWRVIRILVKAHSPWMGWGGLAIGVAVSALAVATGRVAPGGAVAVLLFTLAVYAFANLLWIPGSVAQRVSSLLADVLRGSIYERGQWVVPPEPD